LRARFVQIHRNAVSHNEATNPASQCTGYAVIRRNQRAQSRIRKELVACLRYDLLVWHADTIAVAVAECNGEVRSVGEIPNRLESIRKMVGKLGPVEHLKAFYEAGPTRLRPLLAVDRLKVACEVIAPSLVPVKAGDRVKSDRRDAVKLARGYRAGDLTQVWVPDVDREALRDLMRAREDAKQDQERARQRLGKFLLRVQTARRRETKLDR
jgi:transposase